MKRFTVTLLLLAMLLSLTACGNGEAQDSLDPDSAFAFSQEAGFGSQSGENPIINSPSDISDIESLTSQDVAEIVNDQSTTPSENKNTSVSSTEAALSPSATSDGLRPEFKAAMDSYEAFYDEYCAFMKKYSQNPTDLSLLTEYGKMLLRLEDMNKKFEAWENEDLNTGETKYYIEVNSRIAQKILDAAA